MRKGGFRRLPVVKDEKLVGILTDRDLREHQGLASNRNRGGPTQRLVDLSPAPGETS
jgi:CBS domain-containing protein